MRHGLASMKQRLVVLESAEEDLVLTEAQFTSLTMRHVARLGLIYNLN